MKQTNTVSNSLPQQFSPEFQAWLNEEKTDARRHRQRILTVALIAVIGSGMFLIQAEINLLESIVNVARVIAAP